MPPSFSHRNTKAQRFSLLNSVSLCLRVSFLTTAFDNGRRPSYDQTEEVKPVEGEPQTWVGRFLSLTPDQELRVWAWIKSIAVVFGIVVVLVAYLGQGFFREQSRLKRARRLVERGGYLGAALDADMADPFVLARTTAPYTNPVWRGERDAEGNYILTFTYHQGPLRRTHKWSVNLREGTVTLLDPLPADPRRKPGTRPLSASPPPASEE